jgi:hypothetical protein
MLVKVACTGYVSLGPSQNQQTMVNVDVLLFRQVGGVWTARDDWSTGFVATAADTSFGGRNDILDWGADRANGVTTVRFIRLLDTGDVNDLPFLGVGQTSMTLAFHATLDDYVLHTSAALVTMNLAGGITIQPATVDTATLVHASLCIVAFACLLVLGSFLPRYTPKKKAWWFFGHWLVQGIGAALGVAGAVVGYAMTPVHFNLNSVSKGGHAILGTVVFGGLILQLVIGLISSANSRYRQLVGWEYPTPRLFPEITHWWLGRIVLASGIIAILMGCYESNVYAFVYVCFALYLCGLIVFIVLMEIYVRVRHDLNSTRHFGSHDFDNELTETASTEEYTRM